MTVPPGFTSPSLSAYDPPVEGEGSLDPMGLAAISDRLAEQLVPGVRSRMRRIRFVTAMAVGSMVCETLGNEVAFDDISTPAICFEWMVVEAFIRRISAQDLPSGIPGSQKARAVVAKSQRLSAATYLKAPSVFGFNGVYKPFAIDAGVVRSELEPAVRTAELLRVWEQEQDFPGFVDAVPGTEGGIFRMNIRDQVRTTLKEGRCAVKPNSWLFGRLANSLQPELAGPREKRALRSLVIEGEHKLRAELANLIARLEGEMVEAQVLKVIRPQCSPALGSVVDAVVGYEEFALLLDVAFRHLCAVSHGQSGPLMAKEAQRDDLMVKTAEALPGKYREAQDRMVAIDAANGLEEKLGAFANRHTPSDLVVRLMEHHEGVQSGKANTGKRPWFEPYRGGWKVRPPYGTTDQRGLENGFVHPVRIAALSRFVEDTRV